MELDRHYDVVIVGAGLAGLTLARQLLLASDREILLVDRRAQLPPDRQKVGESTVQVGGYYLSKVLGLERHLLRDHFMKYNLRFYWKTPGRDNRALEDHGQAYIRSFSNVAGYQIDRNGFEAELLRLNSAAPNFRLCAPATDLEVTLDEGGPHSVRLRAGDEPGTVQADWVVDASGRGRLLAGKLGLERDSPVRHGAVFAWVDGLVDVEELTDRSPREVRLAPERRRIGHLPLWLATNHFMGEGFWLWVIPLPDRTSLGLVYDSRLVSRESVSSPERFRSWVCREFPLFDRLLADRELLDFGSFRSVSHGCSETLSQNRWAVSGDAGRFLDPLYSPGCDFIAIHNTAIVDAILADETTLAARCSTYERLLRALYEAYLPGYRISYATLGDQEAFVLKYAWDLSVYYAFYVFPFVNDLFTDRRFVLAFLRRFSRLGRVNERLQAFLADFHRWKKETSDGAEPGPEPVLFDLMELAPLRRAESTFYRVGVDAAEARSILDEQIEGLEELVRYIVAHVASVVADDHRLVDHPGFVEKIDLPELRFDPAGIRERHRACAEAGWPGRHPWSFDPGVLRRLRSASGGEGGGGGRPRRPVPSGEASES